MRNPLRWTQSSTLALCACALLLAQGRGAKPAGESQASDPGWPRQYTDGIAKLVLHQPQVDSWPDFEKMTGRFALELIPAKGAQPVYGTLSIKTDTRVDMEARTVALDHFEIIDVKFPSAADRAQARNWIVLTTNLMPAYPTVVALDRMLAYTESVQVQPRQTKVVLDPPPILVSTQPALLVIIDGKPIAVDIDKTNLQKVVNTNWDLFFDKKAGRYYLRDDKSWLSAKELNDAWAAVKRLPKDFKKLPAGDQYKEVKKTASEPDKPAMIKLVLVVHKPSELILLDGQPRMQLLPGSRLMWVINTECDLFFDNISNEYYYLTSGRWFRATSLKSNRWAAATTSLPEDFKKIPPDHPRAHVLASVPGTRQAEEAVIAASIPRKATIDRKTVKAEVKYLGEPKFEPIGDTSLRYATNTPNDVLLFENRYYACLQGVWFVSTTATGPWEAADKIPEEIYNIPAESSKYNVTYVNVYDSTPETVTYGYTDGYLGTYVGFGVAMWGTGYYYPPYYGWGYGYPAYWPAAYYTYGASAWYNPATGTYVRGSAVYGPYGGYARSAAYNPATGGYAWGRSAWGPYGAAASGGFYNPTTGTWGGSYHASNGYQNWGHSVVNRGSQSVRTASYSDSRGTVAGLQTSAGGKAIAARGSQGQGFAARSASGDFYAGRDGTVYKRDQTSGQWYKNSGGSWDSVNRPTPQDARSGQAQSARSSAGQGAGANRESIQGLDRDAAARSRGNSNAQRSSAARQSWSNSGSSRGGYASRGGSSGRSGGFGRRR